MTNNNKIRFSEIFRAELSSVAQRREKKNYYESDSFELPDFETCLVDHDRRSGVLVDLIQAIKSEDQNKRWSTCSDTDDFRPGLVGLAFSGGGIRSSTFNLGIVQGLHKAGLFECVDYLSTVSGGGYVGSYISSYYHREQTKKDEKFDKTEEEIESNIPFPFEHVHGEEENPRFRHFRNNSNFLAPNGFMETLMIPLVLLRGLVINFLVILPSLIAAAILLSFIIRPVTDTEQETYEIAYDVPSRFLRDQYPAINGELGSAAAQLSYLEKFGTLLPASFPVSALILAILVIVFVMYPLIQMVAQRRSPGMQSGEKLRYRFLQTMAITLIVLAIAFFIELQPFALGWLSQFLNNGITQILAAVSAIAAINANKLVPKLSGMLAKFSVTLFGIVGMVAIWVFILWLTLSIEDATNPASGPPDPTIIWVYAGFALLALAYTFFFVDVNFTSIHKFYRDRLSKAFIFSAVPPKLSELDSRNAPYHLINSTINVRRMRGEEDYENGRSASVFIFSKHYIGGVRTGYVSTQDMEKATGHLDLATAMAVSGAAVAPIMGRFTNPVLSFILALLNLRLNYWLPNPLRVAHEETGFLLGPNSPVTRVGSIYLLREMLGRLRADSWNVNLSDGGHIENLGIYELLRRQCRLIIAADGERDSALNFDGLAEAIRLARIDFGYHVELEGLDEIRSGEQQFAIGTIYYPDNRIGKLLYFKSCLKGDNSLQATLSPDNYRTSPNRDDNLLYDDSAYIARYKNTHPDFPHESTGDQFFDENQFECYRALGYDVAVSTLMVPPRDSD